MHVINSQYLEKTAKAADYPFTVSTSGDRNPLQSPLEGRKRREQRRCR